jgi:hypothetical protein
MKGRADNILIAEFMGVDLTSRDGRGELYTEPSDLRYDGSWNHLMPVIEKIASLKHPIYIYVSHIQKSCIIHELHKDNNALVRNSSTKISTLDITYKSVVEFIKGYKKTNFEGH